MQLPQRSPSHILEELSERYFIEKLPHNWVAEKPQHDYGVDLKVDIYDNQQATGLELLIQLKSSQKMELDPKSVKITLNISTYNFLWKKLQVVMLVKYIQEEQKAYWLLLKDVPLPKQTNKTFTIVIPKNNRLDTIEWNEIHQYVKTVTDRKLAAQNAYQMTIVNQE